MIIGAQAQFGQQPGQLDHRRTSLIGEIIDRVGRKVCAEQIEQWRVGEGPVGLEAAPLEHGHALFRCTGGRLGDQPRFADPGLARNRNTLHRFHGVSLPVRCEAHRSGSLGRSAGATHWLMSRRYGIWFARVHDASRLRSFVRKDDCIKASHRTSERHNPLMEQSMSAL